MRIAMLGHHKRISSREGGIEIVVDELSTRMVASGHRVTFLIERENMYQERKYRC